MSEQERTALETQLAQMLQHSAVSTLATANALDELDRFHASTNRRRVRARVIAAVAAVLVIVGGSAAAVSVIGTSPDVHLRPTHSHSVKGHGHKSTLGSATPLSRTVQVTNVNGPEYLGVAAFGDIWATAAGHPAELYRMSSDGQRLLSKTGYLGVGINQSAPVRLGRAIVVSESPGLRYAVFNSTGKKIGVLPSNGQGAATGDASGGWIATKNNEVARVDSTGLRILRRFTVPVQPVSGLATSPGALWVISSADDQLVRVDTTTGQVTGRLALPSQPTQVAYTDGAVYVAGQDHGLRRIDPATLAITATAYSQAKQAQPVIAAAPAGQLWVQGSPGSVAQLDPTSLRTERNIRVFTTGQLDATADGAVVTSTRIVVTNQIQAYSFPVRAGH